MQRLQQKQNQKNPKITCENTQIYAKLSSMRIWISSCNVHFINLFQADAKIGTKTKNKITRKKKHTSICQIKLGKKTTHIGYK